MIWNKIFWVSFAAAQSALVLFLTVSFSFAHLLSATIILVLGIWKLAEDLKTKDKGIVKVKRELLDKLK